MVRIQHRFALRRLQEEFPQLDPGPLLAHASQLRMGVEGRKVTFYVPRFCKAMRATLV